MPDGLEPLYRQMLIWSLGYVALSTLALLTPTLIRIWRKRSLQRPSLPRPS